MQGLGHFWGRSVEGKEGMSIGTCFMFLYDSSLLFIALQEHLENHTSNIPTENDVRGAAEAVLRLQDTYLINARSFTERTSMSLNNAFTLCLEDIYEIGRTAYKLGNMQQTKEWMELALKKLKQNDTRTALTDTYGGQESDSDGSRTHKINYEVDIRDHLAFTSYKVSLHNFNLMSQRTIPLHENVF